MVWSLQMLTDWCDVDSFVPSDDAEYDTAKHQEELETFCAKARNRTEDKVKIIHVYDDEWYGNLPDRDPLRGGSGTHVFRGGGFDSWAGFVRAADRYSSHSPSLRTDWGGFRVVRETEVVTDKVRE